MSHALRSGCSRLSVAIAAALLVATATAHAQRRAPVPSSDEEQRMINEGNALHDNQDFDGAIASYRAVLERNPHNVDALFELASCQYEKGEYRQSLEAALRGSAYESDNLGYFYILIGTSYDELKQPLKAVAAYKEGIKAEPNSYLLHYNLAVTLIGLHRTDEARESLKRAILLNPNHASSHLALGRIYLASGYRMPALLALCRALVLEPTSGRGESTMRVVERMLGVPSDSAPAFVARDNGRRDEGNFRASEKLFVEAAFVKKEGDEMKEMEMIVARLRQVLAPLASDGARLGAGFAAEYYAPYFAELLKRGHLEAMAYHIFQSTPKAGLAEWLAAHDAETRAFIAWSKSFTWKRSVK